MQRLRRRLPGLLAITVSWMLCFAVSAEARYIYVYTDDQGMVHYSDYLSNVPPQYRGQARAKYLPGNNKTQSSSDDPSKEGTGPSGKANASGSSGSEEVGLTEQQERLMGEVKAVLGQMIPLAARYKDVQKNFTNGRRMYSDIQSNLPGKQSLAGKLGDAKNPLLVQARGFLQDSISKDQNTNVNTGTKRRVYEIYERFVAEAKQAESLIRNLDEALEKSQQDKAEAEAKARQQAAEKKQEK
ncbi:DUF4124 domain-containing protein [Nitrospina watsonii]|uniref:DUF4124 domain-containing protein n=1 Tax=Nitrospina watsonii TaxID=1323948 RepID=A0ABN8W7L2_9BACT|nr:DUF4124 domain-containing protein [Nitrospina watsonii]CAI2719403.1 conserved protein of unknown function [Nitrospina watsonii]